MKTETPENGIPNTTYRYSIHWRAFILCSGFALLLTGLSARLIHVQHTMHAYYLDESEDTLARPKVLPAQRGDLTDRNGRPLATTEPVSTLFFDRHQVPKGEALEEFLSQHSGWSQDEIKELNSRKRTDLFHRLVANRLADPLNRDVNDLYETLLNKKNEFDIQTGIESEKAWALLEELKTESFTGFHCKNYMRRKYVSASLAAHVVGFVDANLRGQSGTELSMNHFLQGEDGELLYTVNGKLIHNKPPQHGRHVSLTIDAQFQGMAEEVMERHYQALRPEAMTAIFMEPHSGEILALVNRPGFHPADGGNAPAKAQLNVAVSSVYEPGSTFKIVTLGTALDQRLVGLDTVVNCYNGFHAEIDLRDASRGRPNAPVRDVLAYSLNTGTYSVAQQMQPSLFYASMSKFGLASKTGIHFQGEATGRIPHPKQGWGRNQKQLSRLGMGYLLNASPLQILGFMNVVCNGGTLVKPRIVREVLSAETGEVTASMPREVVENVVSSRAARLLREALIHAVENGTGKRVQVDGYIVGGKTGTAGKAFPNIGYIENRNIVSFLGFIGNEMDTALIGIVLVDDPQNEGRRHGGSVAGPIFKEIAEAGMKHFGVRRVPELAETPEEQ